MQNRDKENYLKWKRAWYLKNREKEILRKKEYYKTKKGKISSRKAVDNYRERYPEKEKARRLVYYYIRKGLIKRGTCKKCGAKKTDAHHEDYSKPLVVSWLCRKCHAETHRGRKKALKGNYYW